MAVVKLARIARETGFIFWSKRGRKNVYERLYIAFDNKYI